jgi:hypothetical protein
LPVRGTSGTFRYVRRVERSIVGAWSRKWGGVVPVVEASVIAGLVIGWAARKARRAAGRVDETVDAAIDAGADRLHEVVLARVGEPVRQDLAEEAASESAQVSELTRQQVELAVAAAARRDADFARTVSELLAQVRTAERSVGTQALAGPGSTVFTGDATATAHGHGIAVGQAGAVNVGDGDGERGGRDPSGPGRPSH